VNVQITLHISACTDYNQRLMKPLMMAKTVTSEGIYNLAYTCILQVVTEQDACIYDMSPQTTVK
jgi:hypothetical protein